MGGEGGEEQRVGGEGGEEGGVEQRVGGGEGGTWCTSLCLGRLGRRGVSWH